jgi:hypothetical protein
MEGGECCEVAGLGGADEEGVAGKTPAHIAVAKASVARRVAANPASGVQRVAESGEDSDRFSVGEQRIPMVELELNDAVGGHALLPCG